MSIPVIGVAGRIGAGKDVLANYLNQTRGFQVIRFSEALKREILTRLPRTLKALRDLNGYVNVDLEEVVYNLKPLGVRELLQEYGTEVRRWDDSDYWTRKWTDSVLGAIKLGAKGIVAPDMRFWNEAMAIKRFHGGVTVHISRPSAEGSGDSLHASETGLKDYLFDVRFANVGTVEQFHHQIEEWMKGDA